MFKVGDKVRVIKCDALGNECPNLNTVSIITKIDKKNGIHPYVLENLSEYFGDRELELISTKQFTKSDLKDGDIVTYRNGDKRTIKNRELLNKNKIAVNRLENYKEDLTDKDGSTGLNIIKVERPVKYKIVFERKEEILDEVEKEYLRGVIRPFKNKVKNIKKTSNSENKTEYITIETEESCAFLPDFKTNTMYKGMQVDKQYTLEELGL